LLKIGHYPSLSACIIKNQTVVWEKGYGLYDLEEEKPATNHTVYIIASITKTITGTALMQLYDQGRFGLDDDINIYLPFDVRNPNFPNDTITIRMILSHSSSLNNDPLSYYWLNFSQDPPIPWYPYPWLEEYLVPGGEYYTAESWSTDYHPGERMEYANANFDIAAYLVEILSGEPFHEYCEEHIFTPLEMTQTSFCLGDYNIDDVAIPYSYVNRTYKRLPHYQLLHYPVGGLRTSVVDLAHFFIMHMNQGVYNGTRILNADTVEEMHTIQPPGNTYNNFNYGLAWMIEEKPLRHDVFSGHGGDLPGCHTFMLMRQSDNTGIIYFLNSDRTSSYMKLFIVKIIQNLLFFKADHLL
jgi:CubicO group peptidase (beta-lactamase class C family)